MGTTIEYTLERILEYIGADPRFKNDTELRKELEYLIECYGGKVRQTKAKQYKRQAEQWCMDFLMESFPEEVVKCTTKEDLWDLAFPETHYNQILRYSWSTDVEDKDTYKRIRLFQMSPRWIYKQIKKNPLVTKEELKSIAE
jgi:hypothetical protein